MARAVSSPPQPRTGYSALRRGRVSESRQVYLITTVLRDRARVFADPLAAQCAATCFNDARVIGVSRLLAWVLMPDHAHLLLELGDEELSTCVARIKSATARRINARLYTNGPVWQCGFHDHALRPEEHLETVARYVINNPVRASLVQRVEEYPWWNSIWR